MNSVLEEQIIISLGSNLGDRLNALYKALALLEAYPISIKLLSKVYETPAWGFKGDPFYNACVSIKTKLKPKDLLEVLLKVEKTMGRLNSKGKGYSSRTIDLDLLFYKSKNIFSAKLKVPHPKLHKRNFVLAPLCEIAPKFIHPILFQTIEELFKKSSDQTIAIPLTYDLGLPPIFESFPYIVIEGNIGVGKTTLAKLLALNYNSKLLSESFTKNPFLEAFYKDPKTHSLAVENFFLKDRFKNDIVFWKEKNNTVVADFSLYKSIVFARENLNTLEYKIYKKSFDAMVKSIKTPSLLIFLKSKVSRLKANIKKRGRNFEKDLKQEYLNGIQKGYAELLKQELPFPVKELNINELDFQRDKNAFQSILRSVFRASFL